MRCTLALTITSLCGVCWCTYTSWCKCCLLIYFHVYELPAICSEGRPLHDVLSNSRVIIDDAHEDDDGQVTMMCRVPIFVYYRHKDLKAHNLVESHWALPIERKKGRSVSLEKWRQRKEAVGVMCSRDGHPTLGAYYPHCSKQAWSCFDGKCSAYEKTRRLCAGSISKAPYSCYYVPGDASVGILYERNHFPFLWLGISSVSTVWLLQWFWLLWVTVKRECKDTIHSEEWESFLRNDLADSFSHVGGAKRWIFLFLGSTFLLFFLYGKIFGVTAQPDEDPPRGQVTYGIGDLSKDTIHTEKPVPTSLWKLEWQPSPEAQAILLSVASLGTLLYQRWLLRKLREEKYANIPQGPHRRVSMYVSTWRPLELENLSDSSAEDAEE